MGCAWRAAVPQAACTLKRLCKANACSAVKYSSIELRAAAGGAAQLERNRLVYHGGAQHRCAVSATLLGRCIVRPGEPRRTTTRDEENDLVRSSSETRPHMVSEAVLGPTQFAGAIAPGHSCAACSVPNAGRTTGRHTAATGWRCDAGKRRTLRSTEWRGTHCYGTALVSCGASDVIDVTHFLSRNRGAEARQRRP